MKDRIKLVRKTLGLTQSEFGKKIGSTRDAVAAYERGVLIKDPIAKLICKTFNIDYFWLTEGIGEMFTALPDTLLDEVAVEYDLTPEYKIILETFLTSPNEQKEAIKNFLTTLAENLQKKGEE